MTLIGNRPGWVLAMVAAFRLGLVALPCTEQLRAADLELRLRVADPRLVIADERNLDTLSAAGWNGPTARPRRGARCRTPRSRPPPTSTPTTRA